MEEEKIKEKIKEKVQQKIQAILDKCSTGKYIFRGENNKDYDKVSSGLYRQYCQSDDSKPVNERDPTANDSFSNENFLVYSVEKDIVEKIRQHNPPRCAQYRSPDRIATLWWQNRLA